MRLGLQIGFFGLGELEWVDTLPDPPEDLIYTDFIDKGNEMVEVWMGFPAQVGGY
jgi:hypothetical protein